MSAKKSDMFAKLAAQQQAQPPDPITDTIAQHSHESASTQGTRSAGTHAPAAAKTPSPPPVESTPPAPTAATIDSTTLSKGKSKGKRENPAFVQANAYIPKQLRRAVEHALLDIDDLDYSSLVEILLRQWLKSRGVSV